MPQVRTKPIIETKQKASGTKGNQELQTKKKKKTYAWLSSCGAWAYCFTACGIFLDQKSSNLHLLQWHADSHPLCQQGSPLCAHIFNVPNCISFSCLPLAFSKVATGLHRYSLYSLSICAPRETHRLMTFAH